MTRETERKQGKRLDVVDECISLYKWFDDRFDDRHDINRHAKRTIISIGSNISEGNKRNSHKEFIRFLNISLGSIAEFEFQIELLSCHKEEYDYLNEKIGVIRAMTINLKKSVSCLLSPVPQ